MRKEKPASPGKNLRIFALASFLNDLGSDIIYPVWPLFVTTVLKADMAALGFIDGLGEALVSLSSAASGYVSDKIRRRKIFIWIGYLCGGVSRIGYAVSSVSFLLKCSTASGRSGARLATP
jgi:MFS family permease